MGVWLQQTSSGEMRRSNQDDSCAALTDSGTPPPFVTKTKGSGEVLTRNKSQPPHSNRQASCTLSKDVWPVGLCVCE